MFILSNLRKSFFKKPFPQWFNQNYKSLVSQSQKTEQRFKLEKNDFWPCLSDRTSFLDFERHYTFHPAWAARKLNFIRPTVHVDISSIISFVTVASAFIPMEYYDYRPAKIAMENLVTGAQDLTALTFQDNSIESLSCMHTVEHIGLGRYGDSIDYNGDLKAISELSRVLQPKGDLLFVVPIGRVARIQFNAHRIYRPEQIVAYFKEHRLRLVEFSYIPERDSDVLLNPDFETIKDNYGCGCFWFKKDIMMDL